MPATLRYMGSKRSLAPAIVALISELHPKSTLADAFAGTCVIGTTAAAQHRIIANDLHSYAETIAYALLCAPGPVPTRAQARADLAGAIEHHVSLLRPFVGDRIREERRTLSLLETGNWEAFRDFTVRELSMGAPIELAGAPATDAYRANPRHAPFVLCSSYFGSAYFGVEQAALIDSLRYAIETSPSERRPFYLLAFLHAVSHCGAAPGHFAQFLVPRDEHNTRYVAKYRARSPLVRFSDALAELRLPRCSSRSRNRVCRAEASEFLRSESLTGLRSELVVYADPPYSRAQYSRYYHVLETLVRYDYPTITGKGRYRADRVQTDFSRIGGVKEAMESFVSAAAETGAPMFLSYPENGLYVEAGGDLLGLLSLHYKRARVLATENLAHSTMGGAPGTAAVDVTETVYYARN